MDVANVSAAVLGGGDSRDWWAGGGDANRSGVGVSGVGVGELGGAGGGL